MKTLFIGNGINYLNNNNYSWENLLKDLIQYVGKDTYININQKPFPLLFEEIVLRGYKFSKITENDILDEVIKKMQSFKSNDTHHQIINSSIDNIITTNYDYNIENAAGLKVNYKPITTKGSPETIYRLHTYNSIYNKKIWHIHGEINYKRTIMLGHDRYANSLRKYIEYLENYEFIDNNKILSWIDLFLVSDIHIIGCSFDFSEIDLWWILNYRARKKQSYDSAIKNRIFFHLKKPENQASDFYKNKKELLESHYIEVLEYSKSYSEIYGEILKNYL